MIRATVKAFETFPRVTAAVEAHCQRALQAANRRAAQVAQENASLDLELELIPPHGTEIGYSAGIRSRRKSDREGSSTPIAQLFDKGTLGRRTRKLKRARKTTWKVSRDGTTWTATRHNVEGKGIKAERFYVKAHVEGRKLLIAELERAARQ